MTTATAARGPVAQAGSQAVAGRRRRGIAKAIAIAIGVIVVWEGLKFVGGTPWRAPGALPGSPIIWRPPFYWPFANDVALPHVWNIALTFGQPFQRGADESVAQYLLTSALYTWREAAIGFVVGALLGLLLATVFVHSRLLERALVPYVIASQTVPILALAPMIVIAFGPGILSVATVATYLTFFPVTIAMIRGLRSFDPRAMELMRSYAASRMEIYRKLRFPASLPYLFTALKISATASVVGALIGEDAGQVQAGLGRVITTFNQYYTSSPERLWCAIIAAALLGVAFFLVVRGVELYTLRGRPGAAEG
ncbi:MAG TPA: ABC transporter permease subunit [Candidatus Limnocylindrales bacterium]|jgi:NitT/TauT family transport system permease protein